MSALVSLRCRSCRSYVRWRARFRKNLLAHRPVEEHLLNQHRLHRLATFLAGDGRVGDQQAVDGLGLHPGYQRGTIQEECCVLGYDDALTP